MRTYASQLNVPNVYNNWSLLTGIGKEIISFFSDLISYSAHFYFQMDTASFEKYIKGRFGDWSPNVGPVYSSCFES